MAKNKIEATSKKTKKISGRQYEWQQPGQAWQVKAQPPT
jgi:hypothetical protein